MSELKLISPLLDGFAMGAPMSDHDGVRCCPAMKENSENKYIVKIISVPASQKQLEALLLTGAYSDPGEAMDYFKELADGIVKEAVLLKKLSRLEGFLPYEDWQIVPMEDNELGYDVYLYSAYRQSLEKYTRKNLMTHLGAVNLGLDLCAALAICRRAGRIYMDLKPTNIYISEDKEYRIGDLGFASISNLKYTSLPGKYRSAYTAPELHDPMVTLNTTADIYSVGMILYQIYNNGKLPFDAFASAEVYPTPENADYEIAEIIMKAIAPDPADRWQTPIEMGQALVAYMQRNTVNDVPITPPTAVVGAGFTQISGEDPETSGSKPEEDGSEFDFMTGITSDETAPGDEDAEDAREHPISDETASMIAQAEDLLEHDVPAAVVVPESVDVPVPEAPHEDTEPRERELDEEDLFGASPISEDDPGEDAGPEEEPAGDHPDEEDSQDPDPDDESGNGKPKKRGWISAVITVLILALLGCGGFYFYQNFYLFPVDSLEAEAVDDCVTVIVDTDGDASLLTVICTDIYGNVRQQPLTDGQTVFTDLLPDTQYKIQLEVAGFHSLVGSTSSTFSTSAVTIIRDFSAVTGDTDGSVMLSFSVEGPGAENWVVTCSAEGEGDQVVYFAGNSVTISGLTLDKTYHFELQPEQKLFMQGENALDFTASAIILAENLVLTDYSEGTLTAQWSVPEGASPEGWIARCYSDGSDIQTVETTETTVTFQNIDTSRAYTVEVAAKDMTQTVRAHVTANPTNILDIELDESDLSKLVLSWEYEGTYPEGGWLVMYTVDDISRQIVVSSDGSRVEISPRVPGAQYRFEIQSASGSTVFNNTYTHACGEPEIFDSYSMLVNMCEYDLFVTPSDPDWDYKEVDRNDYTTTFASGDPVSMLIKTATHFIPRDEVSILYVIRDENGNVIAELSEAQTVNWYQLWVDAYPYATLDIPKLPKEAGNYTLCLYFNYRYVTEIDITVTE